MIYNSLVIFPVIVIEKSVNEIQTKILEEGVDSQAVGKESNLYDKVIKIGRREKIDILTNYEHLENDIQLLKLRLAGGDTSLSSSSLSLLPVGTILPWLNRIKTPDGSFKVSPDVPPTGWELCDGQVEEKMATIRII